MGIHGESEAGYGGECPLWKTVMDWFEAFLLGALALVGIAAAVCVVVITYWLVPTGLWDEVLLGVLAIALAAAVAAALVRFWGR